jgi:hypothetical protein
MSFFVTKMEWEYGEKYGHVFYPHNMQEFKNKLEELDQKAISDKYPFYVDVYCANDTIIGITVGHQQSVFRLFELLEKGKQDKYVLDWHFVDSQSGFYIEHYYRGVLSEIESQQLLPKINALKALFYYVEIQKLPSYIKLTRQNFIELIETFAT